MTSTALAPSPAELPGGTLNIAEVGPRCWELVPILQAFCFSWVACPAKEVAEMAIVYVLETAFNTGKNPLSELSQI